MAPNTATIFVDDQNPDIHYLCPVQKQNIFGSYYNNTWTSVISDDCSKGWFQYTFNGIGANIHASFSKSSNFSVKLDNGQFVSQTGNGSWTSPLLTDGEHTVTYAMGMPKNVYPALDYIAVTAGPSTSLQDKTIIVDNDDSAISYSGSWSKTSPVSASFDYAKTMYQNSSRWATKAGDSMSFQFEGSSVSLYGMAVFNTTSLQNITAVYTLDGVSKNWTISNNTISYLPLLELFHADVGPGNHTLNFNITNIVGDRSLAIDFVAYNASYSSIQPLPMQALDAPSNDWKPKVGISIGVIAGFALLLALGLFFWRKTKASQRHQGKQYVEHS
ncbi:hypothetical protein CPB83DRAFT_529207 [Crepidotus variabilis]|uniref:Uncharacterized protein n=1 Tax=Crepidotus variabilis TaxID=179855 RepID=A0A9P6EQM9_9AGAR|nr:hypothetical protein CPB83DRAFT_529207 [Crepidotus variabilis]